MTALFINVDVGAGWIIALEYGRVDEGQPLDAWEGVSGQFGLLHDGGPDGRLLGSKVLDASTYDPDAHPEMWKAPTFDVPLVGLSNATPNEIIVATKSLLGQTSTLNRQLFNAAMAEDDPDEALSLWSACLQAGDQMAHYALGYTLYDLQRYPAAYRHLRRYTELSPRNSWAWCWFGQAAAAVGRREEAIAALQRAIMCETRPGETPARERLQALS